MLLVQTAFAVPASYLGVVPPHIINHLQDVQFALVALCQALQDLMEPVWVESEASLNFTDFDF